MTRQPWHHESISVADLLPQDANGAQEDILESDWLSFLLLSVELSIFSFSIMSGRKLSLLFAGALLFAFSLLFNEAFCDELLIKRDLQ